MTTKRTSTNGNGTALTEPTNDGEFSVNLTIPYIATVTIEGTAAIIFHRWSCDDVEAKGKAPKSSAAKKTDNVESYVYRCDDGTVGVPGEYLRQSIIKAGGYRQDPRKPRASAMELMKASIVPLTELASLGKVEWDYLDRRRVTIQRAGITRVRPAFLAGWQATFDLMVNLPEYLPPQDLLDTIAAAGRFVGVADFRPTYGRFQVVKFEIAIP